MTQTDLRITYTSLSVPSYSGETDVRISAGFREGNWNISGEFGHMYKKAPILVTPPINEVEAALSELMKSSVSAVPTHIDGLDGTTYKVAIANGLNHVEYEWWSDVPVGLEPIGVFINKLYKWVGFINEE